MAVTFGQGFNAAASPLTLQSTVDPWKAATPQANSTTKTTTPKATTATAPASAPAAAPTAAPAQSTGSTYNAAAAAAAKAAAQAQADYNTAKTNTYSSINDAIGDTGNKFNSSILDYLDTLTTGQKSIDNAAVQNELASNAGRLGVLDMIGTGLKSAGTTLSARGSTDSSAAEQYARIYNLLGQKQQSAVNNQYETGLADIQKQQDALNLQTSQFQRHYGEQKESAVNQIVQDASSKLASLNAAAQNASLSDRIDIEAQKAAIRNQALNALSQYDAKLSSGISGVTAATQDTNNAKAMEMLQAGAAPDNAFTYTTVGSPAFENTGPVASPLAVYSGKKNNSSVLAQTGV